MKFRRLISVFMLLLSVWFPLDNALAGAVVEGCPMMSHAFERGLHTTFKPQGESAKHDRQSTDQHCQMSMQASSGDTSSSGLAHCSNTCPHCSLCLMLGGVALQLTPLNVTVTPVLSQKILSSLPAAHDSVTAPLFRPPII